MPEQRTPLIAGNWKMNGSTEMVAELVGAIVDGMAEGPAGGAVDVMVMPPFPYLARARATIDESGAPLLLGAQDVSERDAGAFTGEVSGAMLADVGAGHVLVGHSERRELHGETNETVAAKFVAAQAAGLVPVVCVGETLARREAGETAAVVGAQVDAIVDRAGIEALEWAVIAYEPVWAIGTGRTATAAQAQEVHAFIRARLAGHDATIAGRIRILYGGSMKPANAAELLACSDIDGGLIGGASLEAGDFLAIVRAASGS
ncbi:MAG: triose-phosphate isomerase [Wenzhouxiangellaceae bacterium]|nr:triose-phosphate isomerase [Wenzhouxiangellaceae bacterium]